MCIMPTMHWSFPANGSYLCSPRALSSWLTRRNRSFSRTTIANRRRHFVGGSSDLEEELMLLRLKTALLRCCLTEVEKHAEMVAKFGEYLKSVC